jgi:hypothetical protein
MQRIRGSYGIRASRTCRTVSRSRDSRRPAARHGHRRERTAARHRRRHATSRSRTSRRSSVARSRRSSTVSRRSPTAAVSREERQVENYRKLLLSIAKDARVIIIKLADRLHNMRTLDWLRAREARAVSRRRRCDLYAPLAHRFGMAQVKWELEDLAFKHLEPERTRRWPRWLRRNAASAKRSIAQMKEPLEKRTDRRASPTSRSRDVPSTCGRSTRRCSSGAPVRGHLRSARDSRDREQRARVLSRPGRDSRRVDAGAGADQGLHRATQIERLSVTAYDDLWAGAAAVRNSDSHARHAPHGRLWHCGALVATRNPASRRTNSIAISRGSGRYSSCSWTPRRRRVSGVSQARPLSGRDLCLHAHGRCDSVAQGGDAARLRVRVCILAGRARAAPGRK